MAAHQEKDADAKPGWNIEDHARSVLTGRTQQEIAENFTAHQPIANSQQPSATMPEGAVKAPMPRNVSPMLATLATRPPSGDSWLYEVKWDGVRALCPSIEKRAAAFFREPGNAAISSTGTEAFFRAPCQGITGRPGWRRFPAVLDDKGRSVSECLQRRASRWATQTPWHQPFPRLPRLTCFCLICCISMATICGGVPPEVT